MTSKGGPSIPPPCFAPCSLSEPKHRVSRHKGVGKIRPKLPALPTGSWPLPLLPLRAQPLPRGDTPGHPVPPPKSTPRSLLFKPPDEPRPRSASHSWSVKDWFADPARELKTYKPVMLPSEGPFVVFTTSQAKYSQRMAECAARFRHCLQRTADASALHTELQRSAAPEAHVQQILANFLPGTLERYLSCIASFLDLHLSGGGTRAEVSAALLADYLHAAQRSLTQDRGVRRTSPVMCIKALRWWAKHCTWQELAEVMQSPLVSAYSRSTAIYDKREAVPISTVLAAWERMVCSTDCAQPLRLFLGTALLCCHASIRFGDIQRVRWSSLQLSSAGLHGTCAATKTTKQGQPFACTWHGITGREYSSSWLLHWLRELTLRSMKTTMLAAAAQLALPQEDRLAQGHHRDSARLYSRNNTYDFLTVQWHPKLFLDLFAGVNAPLTKAMHAAGADYFQPFDLDRDPKCNILDDFMR